MDFPLNSRIYMNGRYILTILFLSIICFSSDLYACKCQPKGSVDQEFGKHDVVFLGQVLEVKSAGFLRPGFNLVRFMPMKVYKGKGHLPNPEIITIFTPETENECGTVFNRSIDYIVYASGNPAFLRVDSCSLTDIQENSKAVLIQLEKISK